MNRLMVAALAAAALAAGSIEAQAAAPAVGDIYAADGARLDGGLEALTARLKDIRFVALGETHDNPDHHRLQALLVRALRPEGVAFEMVPESFEGPLADLLGAGVTTAQLGKALAWEQRGWPDWPAYAEIFEAAGHARVTGGALARDALRAVAMEGAKAAPAALLERHKLDQPLAPEIEAARRADLKAAHCGRLPDERMGPMLLTQRVWDASFAEAWARAAGEGGRAVLIAGSGHARRDFGAPEALARIAPGAGVAVVAMFGHDPEAKSLDDYLAAYAPRAFDYVLITEPDPPRPDPCAGLPPP